MNFFVFTKDVKSSTIIEKEVLFQLLFKMLRQVYLFSKNRCNLVHGVRKTFLLKFLSSCITKNRKKWGLRNATAKNVQFFRNTCLIRRYGLSQREKTFVQMKIHSLKWFNEKKKHPSIIFFFFYGLKLNHRRSCNWENIP